MEQVLRPIYQERASSPSTLGVVLIEKRWNGDPITDTFDEILLIISEDDEHPIFTKHYAYGAGKSAMHVINDKQLRKWLLLGTRRKVVDWIVYGKVFFDRNEFVETLKKELLTTPYFGQSLKQGLELSKLVRTYTEGKTFFEQQNYMDAYQYAVQSLNHLARLVIIEKGLLPEVTVWSQVKKLDPAIYKLYEELLISKEPLEKRLELLFLASEFFIHNRTENAAQHIMSIMQCKPEWTIQELHEQQELQLYSSNLEVLIEYLIEKGFIEITESASKNEFINHRNYRVRISR